MTTELEEFLENQEKPWWFWRCTHRDHAYWYYPDGSEYGCWRTLRDAEQVVILHLICRQQVHICVNVNGGSSCKTISSDEWAVMSDDYLLLLVQDMSKELRSIVGM